MLNEAGTAYRPPIEDAASIAVELALQVGFHEARSTSKRRPSAKNGLGAKRSRSFPPSTVASYARTEEHEEYGTTRTSIRRDHFQTGYRRQGSRTINATPTVDPRTDGGKLIEIFHLLAASQERAEMELYV